MMKLAVVAAALVTAAGGAELPVRQVVLYKHGIGYFERSGEIAAGQTARLSFKGPEMDDVLKSLVVTDRKGGAIAGVRYDSSEPLARKLSGFPFQLADRAPLSALLDSLKGARVELRFGAEATAGAIVNARLAPGADNSPEKELLTLLTDSGDLRTFDLSAAVSLRLTDPELQGHLREYLAALQTSRSREHKSVHIVPAGTSAQQIVARFVLPVPVWKSSYRLMFGPGEEPRLEGWAIVDNTSGEDWTGVHLSLVSGRPVSFVSRLYEPRYVNRPTAQLPEEHMQPPVIHGGVIEDEARAPAAAERAAGRREGVRDVALAKAGVRMLSEAPAPKEQSVSSVAAVAQARELGELFEYNFAVPVTVRKNESGMLPFLQQKIEARKFLIYADRSSEHPMNAAELTNTTGKTLDGGPVTVFDGGAYGGEALMETLKTSDRRLISYAVDLGTRITTAFDSGGEDVREIHFRRGIMTLRHAARETTTYTIRNTGQKAKTLIIEHPARGQYRLVNVKPAESTAAAYRFEVKLAPGATEKFPVIEERTYESTLAVTNLTPDVLASYVANKTLDAQVRTQLEKLAVQKRVIAETDRELQLVEQEIGDLTQDQNRLRQNISSLSRVSGQQEQVQNYARQLSAQETKLAALRDRQAELRKKKAALESDLSSLIEKMEF